jgi:hypothetical protein
MARTAASAQQCEARPALSLTECSFDAAQVRVRYGLQLCFSSL